MNCKRAAHTQLHTSRDLVPASLRDSPQNPINTSHRRDRRACCTDGAGRVGAQEGDESHELYVKERDGILGSLKRRAEIMADTLNKLEGVTCVPTEGGGAPLPPTAPSDVSPHAISVYVQSTLSATSHLAAVQVARRAVAVTGSWRKICVQIYKAKSQSAPDLFLYRRNPVTVPSALATARAAHRHQNSLFGKSFPNAVLLQHCTASSIQICPFQEAPVLMD